ncbi:universal stress protein [Caenimonas sedimenti]|uniref:Universal stress protein n=1 Tax=Caenimonas sedimenti TaxID=2596921 RepID=A0A562ZX49_9BURK|nr:universal stress protein [Caenimonas sedimenti]TWO72714.1 universal stress protein [Caenimonas sedimenti]
MFKHILLATDGSAASESAARSAVSLARIHGARLTAVFVVDPFPYLGIANTNPMGLHAYLSAARDHAAAAHARVMALCAEPGPAVDLQLRLLEDVTAAKGILAAAKDEGTDLIVAGSHGRSGLDRMLLGSVAGKLVSLSPVPVLIVR